MSRAGRLMELSQYLGRRRRTMQELVQHFGVSESTLYRDLRSLEELHIPLVHDEQGYGLVDGGQVRSLPLSASEHALIRVALGQPALEKQPALAKRVQVLVNKLDRFGGGGPEAQDEQRRSVIFASSDHSGRIETTLFEALEAQIRASRAVEILYASLSGQSRRWRSADPFRLFHRANAWYLAARCHERDTLVLFRVDRIEAARPLDQPTESPADFDLEDHLQSTWRVYRGQEEVDVVLRFAPELGALILNAEHHPGESKEVGDDGWIDYRVRLSSLEELSRWIVGFGGNVRIVGPTELSELVVELAEGTLAALTAEVTPTPA